MLAIKEAGPGKTIQKGAIYMTMVICISTHIPPEVINQKLEVFARKVTSCLNLYSTRIIEHCVAEQRYVHLTSCVYFQSIAKHIGIVNMAMFVILETNSARLVSTKHVD